MDYPDLERKVLEAAAREFSLDRILFSSFNHHSMLRMKQLDSSVLCGLLYEAVLVRPWEYARSLGMDAIHPHYSEVLLPGGECAAAHNAGVRVNTWTVNSSEAVSAVLREGADILITNYPAQALKIAARG